MLEQSQTKVADTSRTTLRNSKSVPSIHHLDNKASLISKVSTPNFQASQISSKKLGFFKRLTTEWNLFLFKVKSISRDVFTTDELIEELFVEQDEDEAAMDKLLKTSNRISTSAEEAFLAEYKKHKNLDKMVESYQRSIQQGEDLKSSTTVVSDSQAQSKLTYTLQDIIRQTTANNSEETMNSEEDQDQKADFDNEISYHDLDLCQLRQELENPEANTLNSNPSNAKIGKTLWDYRRRKWLVASDPEKVAARLQNSTIDHIPKESYYKIYSVLIDKGRPLKNDKKINLQDLVHIINAGWIAEEKWERAAKGLP